MFSKFRVRDGKIKDEQIMGIYEFLSNERVLFLYGNITCFTERADAFSASVAMDEMIALDKVSHNPIKLIVDSPGGSVHTGLLLCDVMKNIESPVYVYGRSCQSMATIVLSAGEKGHRYVYPHSRTMLHLPAGGVFGDTEDIKIAQKEFESLKKELAKILIENGVKKTEKELFKDINRAYWMSAQETIDYGIADQVVEQGTII